MRIGLAFLGLLLVLPAASLAQDPAGPPEPKAISIAPDAPALRTYGTTAKTFVSLSPWHFVPTDSTVEFRGPNNTAMGEMVNMATFGTLRGPLHLPEGALVTEMQAVFCDTSTGAHFESQLVIQPRLAPKTSVLGPSSGDAEAPGCVDRTVVFDTPVQVDNGNNVYTVRIFLTATDTTIQFASLRVGYHLQVSAPGAQVFDDVPPTHLFFQFIQALAAAGITGGCSASPPLYCPDGLLTRGQMAVFLSRALGLHFAP